MSFIDTAKITSKGQVTIPNRVRKLLKLKEGNSVAFRLTKEGVVLLPCEITTVNPYTPKEWAKIEKLTREKGEVFLNQNLAKKYIENL